MNDIMQKCECTHPISHWDDTDGGRVTITGPSIDCSAFIVIDGIGTIDGGPSINSVGDDVGDKVCVFVNEFDSLIDIDDVIDIVFVGDIDMDIDTLVVPVLDSEILFVGVAGGVIDFEIELVKVEDGVIVWVDELVGDNVLVGVLEWDLERVGELDELAVVVWLGVDEGDFEEVGDSVDVTDKLIDLVGVIVLAGVTVEVFAQL